MISVKGYNQLLSAAGEPALELEEGEAAVYAGGDLLGDSEIKLLNRMLEHGVKTQIREESCLLTGEVQTLRLITDRTITLSFALIVPDEMFERYTNGSYETYVNGILDQKVTEEASLLTVIAEINQQLDCTGLVYESYLQNMGRSLFYKVSASYISIYLGLIFLIVANTMISVQFLMSQQKVEKRYRTLIRLGADYRTLFRSVRTQVNWYFGIPAGFGIYESVWDTWNICRNHARRWEGNDPGDDVCYDGYTCSSVRDRMDVYECCKKGGRAPFVTVNHTETGRIRSRKKQTRVESMKRIAVVEDEVFMREELSDILEKSGYIVKKIEEFDHVSEQTFCACAGFGLT